MLNAYEEREDSLEETVAQTHEFAHRSSLILKNPRDVDAWVGTEAVQ